MNAVAPELDTLQLLHAVPLVYTGRLRDSSAVNAGLVAGLATLQGVSGLRRSHFFHGRFENLYVDRHCITEIETVLQAGMEYASRILGRRDLRHGFWFNEMAPGQRTTLHSHDDDDELLSGVYYISAPPGSGHLLIHASGPPLAVVPEPGLFAFFSPGLPHEVEVNQSQGQRLSLAMNFGPP